LSPRTLLLNGLLLLALLLVGCATPAEQGFNNPAPLTVALTVDGTTATVTTTASNVRELLQEVGVNLGEADEVEPPPFTPLSEDTAVRVIRVSESLEIIEQVIPFQRKIVRNENMGTDDPPLILQAGNPGREELTVRIVYRDGLEVERRVTQSNIIAEPQDEIVMVGAGLALPNQVTFGGTLAFIQGGQAVIMRGNTAFPETLPLQRPDETEAETAPAELDRRVFSLSPTGSHLLYTRVHTDTTDSRLFNSFWVVGTARGSEPQPLGVDNVLWADWNPNRTLALQIAYTTGVGIDLPPGWEANNDLWLGEFLPRDGSFTPERVVESYPATYGWWGGRYAWSPDGTRLAYAFADEIGVIDLTATPERLNVNTNAETTSLPRQVLSRFPEYDTRADWVWLPSLSWSPDGQYLVFSQHGEENTAVFDTYVASVPPRPTTNRNNRTNNEDEDEAEASQSSFINQFVPRSGIWGYPRWSPAPPDNENDSRIAFLRSTDPLDTFRSSYTLWLMDRDGSNAYQLYPPPGENSFFTRDEQFMVWNGTGEDMAFIFANRLYLLHLATGDVFRVTEGDALVSHPTWAPYGTAVEPTLPSTQIQRTLPATITPNRPSNLPED
jgi:hypothetical protein